VHLDILTQRLLEPLLQTVASYNHPFTTSERSALVKRTVDLLRLFCERLGREEAQKHLMSLVVSFFSYFNCVVPTTHTHSGSHEPSLSTTNDLRPEEPGASMAFLEYVFTPALAAFAYTHFCKLLGQLKLQQQLPNIAIVEDLVYSRAEADRPEEFPSQSAFADEQPHQPLSASELELQSAPTPTTPLSALDGHSLDLSRSDDSRGGGSASQISAGGGSLPEAVSIGAEILLEYEQVDIQDAPRATEDVFSSKTTNAYNKWADGWTRYWRRHADDLPSRLHPEFAFQGQALQVYTGHTAAVRDIVPMENSLQFLTASKDKTVRLWNVTYLGHNSSYTHGIGGGQCRLVYTGHRRPLYNIALASHLEQVRKGIVCFTKAIAEQPVMKNETEQPGIVDGNSTNCDQHFFPTLPPHLLFSIPRSYPAMASSTSGISTPTRRSSVTILASWAPRVWYQSLARPTPSSRWATAGCRCSTRESAPLPAHGRRCPLR
jgi:hypothetical protein